MNWTKEQREAIETRGKNILVSAAAGSGKTAVLVERIKRLILEEGCSIDRMLIVTFTNAAAAEMKEKIRKAIGEAASRSAEGMSKVHKDCGGSTAFLKNQMNLISSANISTFHSFALEVIRRYFYLIGIEPNFKICDSVQETLLRGEAMDQLLSELFDEGDPKFFYFLKCYSGDRDEKRFREIVDNCYNTIRSLPEPFEWMRKSVLRLKDGADFDGGKTSEFLYHMVDDRLASASSLINANERIALENDLSSLSELCARDREELSILQAVAGRSEAQSRDKQDMRAGYEDMRLALSEFKLPAMSSKIFAQSAQPDALKEAAADNRNAVKKMVKNLRESYFSKDLAQMREEMAKTYEPALYMEEILLRYDNIYRRKKAEKNLADFADIEHYAYEILKDEEAAGFYRDRFKHIFIDEYQDSNVIQEALIDLIKRHDNLFMVGDIKQSIYKFRLAEPEIFQRKYDLYSRDTCNNSIKIDLNKNFRSKKPVIDFINNIFEEIMEGYDQNAKLYAGAPGSERCRAKPRLMLTQVPWDDDSDIDEELKNIMKAEKEAYAAASIIQDSLGTLIFDGKEGCERPLEKRDIVILMRGVKNYGDVFYKILTENNLPAYIDDNDGFFDTMEINAFLSALQIIDNPKQDIHLLTLMRSEMMGFSIEEMVKIRIEFKNGSYYEAFSGYAKAGSDDALAEKCREALSSIARWQDLSKIMPLDKLIWKLMLDTGFYIAMGAMPAGSQRQANLRALTDKAGAYGQAPGGSLYGFIRYIEAVKEKKVSMGQVKMMGEKDDLIRIMTVHKSKGLEFPMVLLAGFCRRLNYTSAGKSPVFHKNLGIGFPLIEPQARWYRTTLLQNMIKEKFRREEADEEKRILYVALTRAMDRLVLLGICGNAQKELDQVKNSAPSDASYFSMTGKIIASLGDAEIINDRLLSGLSQGRRRSISRMLKIMDESRDIDIPDEIERRMTFEYPHAKDLKIRTKYSVSDLNSHGRRAIENLGQPKFMMGESDIGSMARGTIYHCVLEHMDIGAAYREGKPYIEKLVKSMVQSELLTEREAEIVDAGKLTDFALSDLGRRIAKSRRVEKEKRFNFMTEKEGGRAIIRGIIDCFFEEEDGLVIVDYKTGNSRGSEDEVRQRYQVQMEIYGRALEAAAGKRVKETYLYLTDSGKIIRM